jgi:hypothetical protein
MRDSLGGLSGSWAGTRACPGGTRECCRNRFQLQTIIANEHVNSGCTPQSGSSHKTVRKGRRRLHMHTSAPISTSLSWMSPATNSRATAHHAAACRVTGGHALSQGFRCNATVAPWYTATPTDFPAAAMNLRDQSSLAYALPQALARRNQVLNLCSPHSCRRPLTKAPLGLHGFLCVPAGDCSSNHRTTSLLPDPEKPPRAHEFSD